MLLASGKPGLIRPGIGFFPNNAVPRNIVPHSGDLFAVVLASMGMRHG